MSIWNPLVFTPTGRPVGPVAPPSLRVYGGNATAAQVAMAQGAFQNFTASARLSAVPNPTAIGALPDGTRYRIFVVGQQSIMEIWPVGQGAERASRSGIGIVFTAMDGAAVPGHILAGTDSTPQPYILTPEVVKGSRVCTGRWKVRKVSGFSGGKAVFSNGGTGYFTGVAGESLINLPAWGPGMLDINAAAYQYGDYNGDSFVFRESNAVATFRSGVASIPFLRRSSQNATWAMQLVPVLSDVGSLEPHKLELYGGPYQPSSTSPVGELIYTLDIPDDYVPVRTSVSVSADGNNIRMMLARGLDSAVLDLAVSDTALAIVSITPKSAFTITRDPVDETVTESYFVPETLPPSGPFLYHVATYKTELGSSRRERSGGGGYNLRGDDTTIEYSLFQRGDELTESLIQRTVWTVIDSVATSPVFTDTYSLRKSAFSSARSVVINGVPYTTPSIEFKTIVEYEDVRVTLPGGAEEYSSTSGSYLVESPGGQSGAFFIFFDPITRFSISRRVESKTVSTGTRVLPPGGTPDFVITTTTSYSASIIVQFNGAEVMSIPTPEGDTSSYTTFAAADPLTGALVVNLMEVAPITRAVLKSWVFVVDDTGARELSAILPIPTGVEIKVISDNHLLSV